MESNLNSIIYPIDKISEIQEPIPPPADPPKSIMMSVIEFYLQNENVEIPPKQEFHVIPPEMQNA